jgi:hypothetical protein
MSTRRLLLSAVAAVLTLTALLAIGILLFGRFGETEGRILGTTIFLAFFGLLSLPAAILLDQERLPGLAAFLFALSVAGFALATAAIWIGDPPEAFSKLTVTVIAFGLAAAQAGRSRRDGARTTRARFFAGSTALAFVLAAVGSAAVWVEVDSQLFLRTLRRRRLGRAARRTRPVLALRRRQRRYPSTSTSTRRVSSTSRLRRAGSRARLPGRSTTRSKPELFSSRSRSSTDDSTRAPAFRRFRGSDRCVERLRA